MKAPTPEEIKLGYDDITADGPNAEITHQLSMLAATDPMLTDTINRMMKAALAMGLTQSEIGIKSMLCGILIYGLHLGLHIGVTRGLNAAARPN